MKRKDWLAVACILSSVAMTSCGDSSSSVDDGACNPACDATTEQCVEGTCVKLCGNGVLDDGEECDTVDGEVVFADKKTCSDLDMSGDALKCSDSCKIDSSACTAKEPSKDCEDGQKKCETTDDGIVFKTCSNGTWNEGTVCEGACDEATGCLTCTEGAGKCITDENGANTYFTCADGEWDEGTACDDACSDEKGCVCEETATKCDNGYFKTCVDGAWDEGTECTQSCDDTKGCVACINGDIQCGTRTVTVTDPETEETTEVEETFMQKCVGDEWQEEVEVCATQCVDGKGCMQCEGEAVKCEEGNKFACVEGFWSEPESCGENIECKDETTCNECASGSYKCEDGKESLCTDGAWGDPVACLNDAECNEEGTTCLTCSDGSKKCEVDKQYTCVNNEWNQGEYCAMGVSCRDDGISCGLCTNGAKKCEDGKVKTCKLGVWDEGETCEAGLGCLDEKRCRECASKQSECVKDTENEYRSCYNGLWDRNEKCQAGYQCTQTDAETASCVPGKDYCMPSTDTFRCGGTDGATLQQCDAKAYKWTTVQTCPAKTVCHAESGACLDAFVSWNMDNVQWHSTNETESISPKKGIGTFRTSGTVLEIYPATKATELNENYGFEFTYRKPANMTNPALGFTFATYMTGGCTKAQVRINGTNLGSPLDMTIGSKGHTVALDTAKDGDKIELLFYGNTGTYCGRFGNISINGTYIGKTRALTLWQYLTPVVSSNATYGIGSWTADHLPIYMSGLNNTKGEGWVQLTSRNTQEANPDQYLRFDTTSSGYKGVKFYLETYRNDVGPAKVQVDFYANNSPEVAYTTTLTLDKKDAWVSHVIDLGDKLDDKNIVQIQINPYKASDPGGSINFRKLNLLGKKVSCSTNGAFRCTGDGERQVQECKNNVYSLKSLCKEDEICSAASGTCKKKYMGLKFNEVWFDANTQNNASGNPFVNTLKATGFGVSAGGTLNLSRGYGQTYMESASKQVTFYLSTANYSNIYFKFKVRRANAESAKYLRFLLNGTEQHVIQLNTLETGFQEIVMPLYNAADLLNFELVMRVYGDSSSDTNFRGVLYFDDIQLVSRNGSTDTVIAGWDFNANKLEFRPQEGTGSFSRVPAYNYSLGYWNSHYISIGQDAAANVATRNNNAYSMFKVKKDAGKAAVLNLSQSSNPQSYTKLDVSLNGTFIPTVAIPHSGSKTVSIDLPAADSNVDVKLYYYGASENPNKQFYWMNVIEK